MIQGQEEGSVFKDQKETAGPGWVWYSFLAALFISMMGLLFGAAGCYKPGVLCNIFVPTEHSYKREVIIHGAHGSTYFYCDSLTPTNTGDGCSYAYRDGRVYRIVCGN